MKASKLVLTIGLIVAQYVAIAQSISYRVISQDPEYYHTRIHGLLTIPDLNTVNGLGITGGLFVDHIIPNSPITVRTRLTAELVGLGNDRLRLLQDTTKRRMRTYDIGVNYRLFGGSLKDATINVPYDANSKLKGVKAKRITEFMGRAGIYRWGYDDFRAMGLTSGLSIRDRRHTQIEISQDDKYYHSAEKNTEFYADLLFLPINNQLESASYKAKKMGWRIGLNRGNDFFNTLFELSSRPSQRDVGFDVYFMIGMTFGFGF